MTLKIKVINNKLKIWNIKTTTYKYQSSESDSEDENQIRDDEKYCVCKLFTPKRSQREPMFNIHEFATIWQMQTLGSFDLLYWKMCDQGMWWIFMLQLQELLVLKSWYH